MRSCSGGRGVVQEAGNVEVEASGARWQRTQRAGAGAALLSTPQRLSSTGVFCRCNPSSRCRVSPARIAAARRLRGGVPRLHAVLRAGAHVARISRYFTDCSGRVEGASGGEVADGTRYSQLADELSRSAVRKT